MTPPADALVREAAPVAPPAPLEARRPERLALLPSGELEAIRDAVRALIDVPYAVERRLRGALGATLATPGSLWRAQLAWAVARAEGLDARTALALAVSVEAFHTGSLLFDDLPAMDDATTRRGRPCVHRTHGEAAAILAALAFVNEGHARLGAALDGVAAPARAAARELAVRNLGAGGILDGQSRDVHPPDAPATAREAIQRVAGKTVPLLRLAIELPAVAAGAPPARVALYGRLAESIGLAYQLLDDLEDDAATTGEPERSNASDEIGRAAVLFSVKRQLGEARALRAAIEAESPAAGPPLGRLLELFEARLRGIAVVPA